jgi:hypothetical protein
MEIVILLDYHFNRHFILCKPVRIDRPTNTMTSPIAWSIKNGDMDQVRQAIVRRPLHL